MDCLATGICGSAQCHTSALKTSNPVWAAYPRKPKTNISHSRWKTWREHSLSSQLAFLFHSWRLFTNKSSLRWSVVVKDLQLLIYISYFLLHWCTVSHSIHCTTWRKPPGLHLYQMFISQRRDWERRRVGDVFLYDYFSLPSRSINARLFRLSSVVADGVDSWQVDNCFPLSSCLLFISTTTRGSSLSPPPSIALINIYIFHLVLGR